MKKDTLFLDGKAEYKDVTSLQKRKVSPLQAYSELLSAKDESV